MIKFKNKRGRIYVEVEYKDKKGTYLFDEETHLDSYVEYLKRRGTENEIKLKDLKKEFRRERYARGKTDLKTDRITKGYKQRNVNLEQSIERGIVSATMQGVEKANREDILRMKRNLMKTLVLDKDLLNLIATEENFKKIQHRLEYEIELKNAKGITVVEANKHGLTPTELIKRLKNAEVIGRMSHSTETGQRLRFRGITNNRIKIEGEKVASINIRMIFRKR